MLGNLHLLGLQLHLLVVPCPVKSVLDVATSLKPSNPSMYAVATNCPCPYSTLCNPGLLLQVWNPWASLPMLHHLKNIAPVFVSLATATKYPLPETSVQALVAEVLLLSKLQHQLEYSTVLGLSGLIATNNPLPYTTLVCPLLLSVPVRSHSIPSSEIATVVDPACTATNLPSPYVTSVHVPLGHTSSCPSNTVIGVCCCCTTCCYCNKSTLFCYSWVHRDHSMCSGCPVSIWAQRLLSKFYRSYCKHLLLRLG